MRTQREAMLAFGVRKAARALRVGVGLASAWANGRAPKRSYWPRLVSAGVCTQEELEGWAEERRARRARPRMVACPCCGHVFDGKKAKVKIRVFSLEEYAKLAQAG